MSINESGWKPEMIKSDATAPATFTGNRALMLEEALIFEIGDASTTGVDFARFSTNVDRLAGLARNRPIGLPGLSEPKPCATIPVCRVRIMRLIWAFFHLGRAR
jgi:glycine dehydrogenase subunit 2